MLQFLFQKRSERSGMMQAEQDRQAARLALCDMLAFGVMAGRGSAGLCLGTRNLMERDPGTMSVLEQKIHHAIVNCRG